MSLHSIHEYRKSQKYVKDLEKILKIVNATEASLRSYKHYRPVHDILTTINSSKGFLEIFLEQNKIIVATKGEKRKQ